MSLVSEINYALKLPDSVTKETKESVLKEIIENSHFYPTVKEIIDYKIDLLRELGILGTAEFLKRYIGIFSGNFELRQDVCLLKKTLSDLYG